MGKPSGIGQGKKRTLRICIDYRKVNEVTKMEAYPRIEDYLDSLKGAQWFSTLDLASGNGQVEMEDEDKCQDGILPTI